MRSVAVMIARYKAQLDEWMNEWRDSRTGWDGSGTWSVDLCRPVPGWLAGSLWNECRCRRIGGHEEVKYIRITKEAAAHLSFIVCRLRSLFFIINGTWQYVWWAYMCHCVLLVFDIGTPNRSSSFFCRGRQFSRKWHGTWHYWFLIYSGYEIFESFEMVLLIYAPPCD